MLVSVNMTFKKMGRKVEKNLLYEQKLPHISLCDQFVFGSTTKKQWGGRPEKFVFLKIFLKSIMHIFVQYTAEIWARYVIIIIHNIY